MTALLLIRLVLAAVFVIAGVTKASDLEETRRALIGFGVPRRLTAPGAVFVIGAELIIAIALVPAFTAQAAAVGAAVLLGVFTLAIVVNLIRGRTPDCHCFGQLHSAPVGWRTLLRNAALATGAAAVIGFGSGPSINDAVSGLSSFEAAILAGGVMLAVAVAVLSWLVLRLMQQNGALSLRLRALEETSGAAGGGSVAPRNEPTRGLPSGARAPMFTLPTLSGVELSSDDLLAHGRPLMLVFTDPGCISCAQVFPDIVGWQEENPADLEIALVSRGTVEANIDKLDGHPIRHVLLQHDREVASQFKAVATPMAVVVDPGGNIASSLAAGAEEIRRLAATVISGEVIAEPGASSRSNLSVGVEAPEVELPDLEGVQRNLREFRGHDVLLLFWDPNCGYCDDILPDVVARQLDATSGRPELVVVSRGSPQEVQDQKIRATILMDHGFATGRTFGARGTPSAIVVDADGRIQTGVASGTIAVADLLAGKARPEAVPTG